MVNQTTSQPSTGDSPSSVPARQTGHSKDDGYMKQPSHGSPTASISYWADRVYSYTAHANSFYFNDDENADDSGDDDRSARSTPSSSQIMFIQDPRYRARNLHQNGIILRGRTNPLPERVQSLVERLSRISGPPSQAEVEVTLGIEELENLNFKPGEAAVCTTFSAGVLVSSVGGLLRSEERPLNMRAMPSKFTAEQLADFDKAARDLRQISRPVPDILYGYSQTTFSSQHQDLLERALEPLLLINSDGILMPFLLIELKGGSGSLWEATNQCLGGAALCVNIGNHMNGILKGHGLEQFNGSVFSIAMNDSEARLFVSWRHESGLPDTGDRTRDSGFHMQKIRSFALQNDDGCLEFQRFVKNILDWGKGERLEEIKQALNQLNQLHS